MRLSYQASYDWSATLAFLGHRAIDGVERVELGMYRRTIACHGRTGILEVSHDDAGAALVATFRDFSPPVTRTVVERVRHMFDLDADLRAIAAHLVRDPSMASRVAARPALRVFHGWDGFEVAARSVIGQQVTVARARQLNGILVDRCGSELLDPPAQRARGGSPGQGAADVRLGRLFPTAQHVLHANLSAMGMPGARVATLKNVAAAVLADPHLFDRGQSIDDTVGRLRAIRGIGDWTAHYIAMRACGEPDAFPASDVGLLRGATDAAGRRPTPGELLVRADAWRPWRAYAAHHLWALDEASRKKRPLDR